MTATANATANAETIPTVTLKNPGPGRLMPGVVYTWTAGSADSGAQHAYAPFCPLPPLSPLLAQSGLWMSAQKILRALSAAILNPQTSEAEVLAEIQRRFCEIGWPYPSMRLAQPLVVPGAPGAFGGESEVRVVDPFGPNEVVAIPKRFATQDLSRALEVLPPLLAAATARRRRVAQRLIDLGADVNQASEWDGRTALMIAASRGDLAMVNVLLAGGANALRVDADDNTALAYALACSECYDRRVGQAIADRLVGDCPEILRINPTAHRF